MTASTLGRRIWAAGAALLLSACATTGVNPTGLTGGETKCVEGPRQSLDCRGALQQFARDFKADLSFMSKAQIGLAMTSTKLTEADALSSDLLQHYYQTCTLYNACIISRHEYAAKTEKLQEIQLQVRRALVGGGFGAAQNIQINPPPFGAPPPPGFPPPPGGGFPPPPGGGFPPPAGGFPPPSGGFPPPGGFSTQPGYVPPVGFPQQGGPFPQVDPVTGYPLQAPQPYPGQPSAFPSQSPTGGQGTAPGLSMNIPPSSQGPQDRVDTILNILREGSKLLREKNPPTQTQPAPGTSLSAPVVTTASMSVAPPGGPTGTPSPVVAMAQAGPATSPTPSAPPPPQEDLDSRLRAMLASLKQEVTGKSPSRASGQAVVGNFTEEGQPWSSPLGALLQERVATLVETEGLFKPVPAVLTRGITIKQVAAVENPNDSKALGALYNTDLAIVGTYLPQSDRVLVRLTALDDKGGELAKVSNEISTRAIPDVVAAAPLNSAETAQLLSSFDQLGPRSQGDAKVEVTTNRPGAGASFRLGEEIRYFVTSTSEGNLYLFHIDADKNVLRIFPNQYQREGKIRAGTALEIPAPGAPFKFEASPPFGLETTFAIVTRTPLDEKDFQLVEGVFSKPKQDIPSLVATRGISVKPVEAASAPASPSQAAAPGPQPQLVWNSVTVLIRP